MDRHESQLIRTLFDEQIRRRVENDEDTEVTATPHFVQRAALDDVGWSEISWTDLDTNNARRIIAERVEYFKDIGRKFAWRVFNDDHPKNLGTLLEDAGLTLAGSAELMIARVSEVDRRAELPQGTSLVNVNDVTGIDHFINVHEVVFGHDHSQLRTSLLRQLGSVPPRNELVIAMAEGLPVSSARVEFLASCDFASLWGGSTLFEWRGRGLYRAMVAYRASAAERRGYTYLSVTASSQSRGILEYLNFSPCGTVSTYDWKPATTSR